MATPVDPSATANAQAVLTYLQTVATGPKVLSGQVGVMRELDFYSGSASTGSVSDWNTLFTATGKYPAILGIDYFRYSEASEAGYATFASNYTVANAAARDHWSKGGLVFMSSTFYNFLNGHSGSGNNLALVTNADAVQAVIAGTTQNTALNAMLDIVAAGLTDLQTNGTVPVVYRPWHDWGFYWGTANGWLRPTMRNIWRYTQNYISVTKGCHNVLWHYAPTGVATGPMDADWYPGSDVVDVVGVSEASLPTSSYKAGLYDAMVATGKVYAMAEFDSTGTVVVTPPPTGGSGAGSVTQVVSDMYGPPYNSVLGAPLAKADANPTGVPSNFDWWDGALNFTVTLAADGTGVRPWFWIGEVVGSPTDASLLRVEIQTPIFAFLVNGVWVNQPALTNPDLHTYGTLLVGGTASNNGDLGQAAGRRAETTDGTTAFSWPMTTLTSVSNAFFLHGWWNSGGTNGGGVNIIPAGATAFHLSIQMRVTTDGGGSPATAKYVGVVGCDKVQFPGGVYTWIGGYNESREKWVADQWVPISSTTNQSSAQLTANPPPLQAATTAVSQSGTRTTTSFPFAQNAPCNQPIGSNAQYSPAGFTRPSTGSLIYVDQVRTVNTVSGDPAATVYTPYSFGNRDGSGVSWTPVANGTLPHFPQSFLVPDATSSSLPNEPAAIIDADKLTIRRINGTCHISNGAPLYGYNYGNFQQGLLTDQFPHGGHATQLDPFAQGLRPIDFSGPAIYHALGLELNEYRNYKWGGSLATSYVWPAISCDSYAGNAWTAGGSGTSPSGTHYNFTYGSLNPNLPSYTKIGALAAILPGKVYADYGVTSAFGKKLFDALQNFGGYLCDSSAGQDYWNVANITCWDSALSTYFSLMTATVQGELANMIAGLYIVTNNSPTSIGGGGTPRVPLAPTLVVG